MKIVVTGADGFLGWHSRVLLSTLPDIQVHQVGRGQWDAGTLAAAVSQADAVLHLAGINRGTEDDVADGNVALADGLVDALQASGSRARVVYAGSTYADPQHPGTDSPYGRGKRQAGERLRRWAATNTDGGTVCEIRFPGLFGEHGRPDYNSFVATFTHRVVRGENPQVLDDRPLPLMHVHTAAKALVEAIDGAPEMVHPQAAQLRIGEVLERLTSYHRTYLTGQIPALATPLDTALFNTLRAAMWDTRKELRLTSHSDQRGTLVECVRVSDGGGQTFVSTTNPGFTRGDHFHLRKIERFQVLSGQAVIRLRRMLYDDVVAIPVSGDDPVAVDMPTLWTHSIENTGTEPLVTLFWINELFDPADSDTYPHPVLPSGTDR